MIRPVGADGADGGPSDIGTPVGADEYIGLTNDAKVRVGPIFYPRGTGTGADRTKRSEYRAALGTGGP